jgi:hypothetical protein
MAQMVEQLPNKYKNQSSNSNIDKTATANQKQTNKINKQRHK